MKISVLCENTASSPEFACEHGLSLYIESGTQKILFDCGQSDVFLKNAEKLGLRLQDIDFAFISHGHYDHGGGLSCFLGINDRAEVYLAPGAFEEHFNAQGKYIGLDPALRENKRLKLLKEPLKIGNARLQPCFSELTFPLDSAGLQERQKGELKPDPFLHEQYLLLNEGGRRILISGCSHRGILNIMAHFKPDVLVGGFHFMKQDIINGRNSVLDEAAEVLNSYNCRYYTCHCTGLAQYEYLKKEMGANLSYISSGETVFI